MTAKSINDPDEPLVSKPIGKKMRCLQLVFVGATNSIAHEVALDLKSVLDRAFQKAGVLDFAKATNGDLEYHDVEIPENVHYNILTLSDYINSVIQRNGHPKVEAVGMERHPDRYGDNQHVIICVFPHF